MPVNAVWVKIDGERMAADLERATEKLNTGEELVLDFSSIQRIDSSALGALQKLANLAEEKAARVTLERVNVAVYKVLKLTNLSARFTYSQ